MKKPAVYLVADDYEPTLVSFSSLESAEAWLARNLLDVRRRISEANTDYDEVSRNIRRQLGIPEPGGVIQR